MNWIDFSLAVIFLLAVYAGWRRGLILGLLDLAVWAGSFGMGYIFYPKVAKVLAGIFNLGAWLLPVAFILTVIIARLLLGMISRYIFRAIPEKFSADPANKTLGIVPGAVNGFFYCVIISALLLALPLKESITRETRESRLAGKLAMQSEWVNKKLAPVFDQAVRQTMNSLAIMPESHEKVALHFKYDQGKPRPDLEAMMIDLINEEREKEGLTPLKADPDLVPIARAHSNDMFTRGYFAHENPEGMDPFDRMKKAHIRFSAAGENLALAQTLEIAHKNLMNSPGHRANILNPSFGRIGIGILDGGFYGLMISQEFRN
ncbi:MAG TPA: CvpA family protein [Chitinophagaceae bacterium]|nr:CvpA family protein [Chitinophagaceae bacterium]